MTELLLHPQTKKQVELFNSKPLHALLLLGPPGSGKRTLARQVAAVLLQIDDEYRLEDYPYYFALEPTPPRQEISIDAVRQVIRELRLNTTGSQKVQRVILLEDAHKMSAEAQNALLKTLEEPSSKTVFILTAPTPDSVLPTVASRMHKIYLRPVNSSQAKKYFEQFPQLAIEKAWHLSGGNIGLLKALLDANQDHPLALAVEQAKQFLKQDKYNRLLLLNSISTDRAQLLTLLDALGRVLRALYSSKPEQISKSKLRRILAGRKLIDNLSEALAQNANPKLVSLQLALNLEI